MDKITKKQNTSSLLNEIIKERIKKLNTKNTITKPKKANEPIPVPLPPKKNIKLEENNKTGNLGIFEMPEKIVVIGDIHGDYIAFTETLEKAGLIDKSMDWTARKTTVVIIGDLVDGKARMFGNWEGDSDLKVIKLVNIMEKKAREKDARIIILLGNHEIMNMNGNFNYSSNNSIKEMGGKEKRQKYFDNEFREFAKKCFLVVKFGNWVFSHAGIPQEISNGHSIPNLNQMFYKYLDRKMNPNEISKFNNIISGKSGILTNRQFGGDDVNVKRLQKTLENMGAQYMVVGHTVQKKVNSVCNGKLWRVDTGMSRAFGENNENRKGFLLIYESGKKTKTFK